LTLFRQILTALDTIRTSANSIRH